MGLLPGTRGGGAEEGPARVAGHRGHAPLRWLEPFIALSGFVGAGVVVGFLLGATADVPRFVRLHLEEKARKLLIVNTASIAAVLPEQQGNGGSFVFVAGARTFEVSERPEEIAALMR